MRRHFPVIACAALIALPAVAVAAAAPPSVLTGATMSVGSQTATVSGTVNPNGLATRYAFQWGPSTQYGLQTPTDPQPAGSDQTAHLVAATLKSLPRGTRFHYRIIAISPAGISVGADASFKTGGKAPRHKARKATATTSPATKATLQVAQLNGTLRSRDATVAYFFEYGLTPVYGTQTRHQTAGASDKTQRVAAALNSLLSHRTYHFRLVVHMRDGRVIVGSDRTFFTRVPHRFRPGPLTLRGLLRRGRSATTIALTGRVTLPSQVSSDNGCNGLVVLQVRRGKRIVSQRRVNVAGNCSYHGALTLHSRPPSKRGPIRVLAHFVGNDVLEPATSSPLRLGRA